MLKYHFGFLFCNENRLLFLYKHRLWCTKTSWGNEKITHLLAKENHDV